MWIWSNAQMFPHSEVQRVKMIFCCCNTVELPLLLNSLKMKRFLLGRGGTESKNGLGLFCFVLFSSCRFCTLDANWFLAPCLSAHHMLGQWTGISVDERFATLIWRINAYAYAFAIFLPCGVHQFSLVCLYFIDNFTSKNFWFQHAFVVSSV